MKKRIAPLMLHRETLRSLVEPLAEGAKAVPGTHYETICDATCDTQTNNR